MSLVFFTQFFTQFFTPFLALFFALFFAFFAILPCAAAEELSQMSLEELMDLEVTSVSKKAEPRSAAAAAVHVLSAEDLRRSGARSLPDALRTVPGVHVARIAANQWAVSVRGFGGPFSNKLLVLRDGRTLYTPLFAGVFWDVQDLLFEDVERVEVVRGPGGTLWGANAMNGVINVITKSARDTHGAFLEAGGGTEETGFGAMRYGARLGERFHGRLYASYFDRDDGFAAGPGGDGGRLGRMGFRIDGDGLVADLVGGRDEVMLNAETYEGHLGQPGFGGENDVQGAYVLGRWVLRPDEGFHGGSNGGSEWALQAYYDHTDRNSSFFRERRGTFGADFQNRRPLPGNQELVWGGEYRITSDDFRGGPLVELAPDSRDVQFVSGFLQDEIRLFRESLRVTLGSKFEHNDFTGFEVQPSGRLAWAPSASTTLWASASRAVRVPSRVENDIRIDSPPDPATGFGSRILGNRNLGAEDLLAWEAGFRLLPARWLLLDTVGFLHEYDDLVSFGPGAPATDASGRPLVPFAFSDGVEGDIYGVEAAAELSLFDWWRLRAAYTWLEIELDARPGQVDPQGAEGSSPVNQVALAFHADLPRAVAVDVIGRYVDRLPAVGVDSYATFDVRLARMLRGGFEVAVAGRDLAEARHREFSGGSQVQRSVWASVTWRRR